MKGREIPVSMIGYLQKLDIERSRGIIYYNDIARICTVIKPGHYRGDRSPMRMAELFGGNWKNYNNHFIIQVAGCPLRCPYCYVDNLEADLYMSIQDMVTEFAKFKEAECAFQMELNVFHLMGGDPAIYADLWPPLRLQLDNEGFEDIILFSDTILIENHLYGIKPWEYLNLHHFILSGCLKGTNRKNYIKNSGGMDYFDYAMQELENYIPFPNFYLTLLAFMEEDLGKIYKVIPKERIDFLEVINYIASQK